MKRVILCASIMALLAGSVVVSGEALPIGKFSGSGTWTSQDGQTGKYQSALTITADVITWSMESDGEHSWSQTHTLRLAKRPDGQYGLLDGNGTAVGTLNWSSNQCKYSITQGGARVQATMKLAGNQLQCAGSKSYGPYQIEWTEVLNRN